MKELHDLVSTSRSLDKEFHLDELKESADCNGETQCWERFLLAGIEISKIIPKENKE